MAYKYNGEEYDTLDAVKAAVDNSARGANEASTLVKELEKLRHEVRVATEAQMQTQALVNDFLAMKKQQEANA